MIEDRKELAKYYQEFYKTGYGAEVGVYWGLNSDCILKSWSGRMFLVDPWAPRDTYNSDINDRDLEEAYIQARTMSEKYKGRAILLRMESIEAASLLSPEILDCVYIDAEHSYQAVKEDLTYWQSRVRPGGLIAGHDYYDAKRGELQPRGDREYIEDFGVKKAVDEFISTTSFKLQITAKEKCWFFIKE